MKPLPMPLRIAAGLVATAIEEAQQLPRKLVELPVTAVSQALQATMRVQQRVTELAIKGDRALGALRSVPETPAWARFDEDEENLSFSGPGNGVASNAWAPATAPPRPARRTVSAIPITRDFDDSLPVDPDVDDDLDTADLDTDTTPDDLGTGDDTPDDGGDDTGGTEAVFDEDLDEQPPAVEEPASSGSPAGPDSPPEGLEEYESWTLPQLRGRFRSLSLEQVQALLTWESSHQDRPPYVTMLSNRVASITGR
jgi:hypothetical protein